MSNTLSHNFGKKKRRRPDGSVSLTPQDEQELFAVCRNMAKRVLYRYPEEIEDGASSAMMRALPAALKGCTPQSVAWAAHKGALEHFRSVEGTQTIDGKRIYGNLRAINKPATLELTNEDGAVFERKEVFRNETGFEGIDSADRFSAFLRVLPERQALIIRRCYIDELPTDRIGEELGVSESRVFQLRKRALATLKRKAETLFDSSELPALFTRKPNKTDRPAKGEPMYRCAVCDILKPVKQYGHSPSRAKIGERHTTRCRKCESVCVYADKYRRKGRGNHRHGISEFLRNCYMVARQFGLLEWPGGGKKRQLTFSELPPEMTHRRKGRKKGQRGSIEKFRHVIMADLDPIRKDPAVREFLYEAFCNRYDRPFSREYIDEVMDTPNTQYDVAEVSKRIGISTPSVRLRRRNILLAAFAVADNPRAAMVTLVTARGKRQKKNDANREYIKSDKFKAAQERRKQKALDKR